MRRLPLMLALAITGPLSAQFATFDGANYGLNAEKLRQGIADAQRAIQYYEMARNAAAFMHNPAAFLAATSAITGMAMSDSVRTGWTTQKQADQLRARLQMGQVLMQESSTIGSLSHGNAMNAQSVAVMMQTTSAQLAQLNEKMRHEQKSEYYKDRNQYQDQGRVIAAWRLK